MSSVTIRRIVCGTEAAAAQLAQLRTQLSAQGNLVSARGKELTEKVFGEALPPVKVVERICADVASQGTSAVLRYTAAFDRVELTPATIAVTRSEMALAHAACDPALLETVRRVRQNVLTFQLGILHRSATLSIAGKRELRLRYRPIRRAGILVPGGAAAYPSTLLMTVVPAQAAGVPELAVVMPPTRSGAYNTDLLAVCHELGVTEVYRIGGAQAVAALAYGLDRLPPVDMIVGPGNLFVALAKRHVSGQVAIDCFAGPSEVVVLADESAPPAYVAADMLAQAEHNPGSAVLVVWKPELLDAFQQALEHHLGSLSRADVTRDCLEQFSAFVVARSEKEALAIVNQLAPEHLHIATTKAEEHADAIDNAGAIFLGNHTPVALGDYAAGPSHVLPTGAAARFSSGLSANDFLKRTSMLSFTPTGLEEIAPDVELLAQREGLTAHALSVSIRRNST